MANQPIPITLTPPRLMEKAGISDLEDERWANIRAIIAAIAVPKARSQATGPESDYFSSQSSTPVDDDMAASNLLLPKVVDTAAVENAYGTFDSHTTETERTVVPLHPTTLLTSAALTPVYLILMLLPMLPFWIFAGFLVYVAATEPFPETQTTLIALAFLIPFNAVGTWAIIRFALGEREKALQNTVAEDIESGSSGAPSLRRSSTQSSSARSEKKRLWRPSMQFVLYGARREGRRVSV